MLKTIKNKHLAVLLALSSAFICLISPACAWDGLGQFNPEELNASFAVQKLELRFDVVDNELPMFLSNGSAEGNSSIRYVSSNYRIRSLIPSFLILVSTLACAFLFWKKKEDNRPIKRQNR